MTRDQLLQLFLIIFHYNLLKSKLSYLKNDI